MQFLPLFDAASPATLRGGARRVADPNMLFGHAVVLGWADDSLEIGITGSHVGIVFLKHDWSGIVQVTCESQVHTLDFFSATPAHWLLELPLGNMEALLVVRPTGERHASSHSRDVWLEAIYASEYSTHDLPALIHATVHRPQFTEADLNQVTDVFKWHDSEWHEMLDRLRSSPPDFVHRKACEWGQCVYGLDRLGMLRSGNRALGGGVGWEPISFFLANHLSEVVATDLYPAGTNWSDMGAREGNPDKYALFCLS